MKISHYQTQDALSKPVTVLRQLDMGRMDPQTVALLAANRVRKDVSEGDFRWFHEGYILNDLPRDAGYIKEIMGSTLGFAIARTDSGEVLRTFGRNELGLAEKAARGVKLSVNVAVEVPTAEEE